MQVPLHWTLKFPLIVLITLVILLSSYHYLVRPSFIGELLNGRKYPRHRQTTTGTVLADATNPARNDSGPIVVAQLSDVSKRYGTSTALDHVSLAVQPGELLAVLGPNGAGKTTAIGLWLGTHEPDQGIVRLMGASPRDVHSRLGVGVMLQEVHLAPELSAREHIELTASYYRDPLSIDDAIALAGIAPIAHQRYGRLSGGQKRQVQFAAAICGRPQLLFLDEPTVGLDIAARETMWRTIRRLRDQGCAIVLTTHYLEEAETLSDRVVVMAKGRVIAQGSVTEMRALVARKRVSCASVIAVDDIKSWTGVVDAIRENDRVHVTTVDAETLVRRLLATDQGLSHLEVKQASLADAFTELTREAA
ncbi:MAG: ABC transporter ATP-binding protein [Rhodanobacteraceae bacterium]|nr:ABC transporter ATP-binding protein [Rhodanobacteraceae bacterium]MBP9153880.1 ABC transporter ATP-binding protein [Xanthomonadales bacterium]